MIDEISLDADQFDFVDVIATQEYSSLIFDCAHVHLLKVHSKTSPLV